MATHPPHILVVDDDPPSRQLVCRALVEAHFRVSEAHSGAEALKQARTRRFDLVVLDSHLSDMDGHEVCRRLKVDPACVGTPVLHLSAPQLDGAEPYSFLNDGADGADGYLTQPVDALELVAMVRSLLRARRAEDTAKAFARQWQKTFDAISDGVCLLDRSGVVVRCNRAFCQLVARSFVEVIGSPHHRLLQGAFGATVPLPNLAAVGQGDVLQLQAPGPLPGDLRWFRVAADPVVDDDQQPTGAVLVITDITETKRTEAAIRKSNQDLLEANRMKDEFLATLSHELRTPLNAMLGWTRLMRSGRLDERARSRALDTIERNAHLQAKLVDDLLDVSRIITGKLRLRIATIDPISVIEAAINSVRPAADAKCIRVDAELDPKTGLMLADGDRLQQVMWNLLSNAIKFTPAGGHVCVLLECGAQALRIQVRDTGCGIAPQFLPFVFDRFRQADSSTTRIHGGLGLGLAIVRHLVELHGGTVAVESPGEGRGANFALALPLKPRDERVLSSAPALAVTHQPLTPVPTHTLDGIRVLIVDDEEDARELLSAAFSQMGAQPLAAGSVDEALKLWEAERPNVIISDIAMPAQDGYAFARQLRSRESELGPLYGAGVPMIAVTAYATTDDTRRAREAGYDLHVAKPVDAMRLAAAISQVLDRPCTAREETTLPISVHEA